MTVKFRIISRVAQGLLTAAVAAGASLVGLTAIGQGLGVADVPLAIQFGPGAITPHALSIHMTFGGAALLLALAAALLRGRPAIHRPLGRVASVVVCIAGVSAIPVALSATGTLATRLGFLTQGLVWLALLGIGLGAIARRDIERHRIAMAMMTAVAFGAVVLRVLLALQMMLLPFHDVRTAYERMAWLSWLIPLCAVALYLMIRPWRARPV